MKSVLLEFLSTEETTIIFVIRQDWKEKGIKDSKPLVFEADFNEEDVEQCVKEIRGLYNEWQEHNYLHKYLDNIKLEDRSSFYTIGDRIFSDELMSAIDGYDLIYFVPFSALHHLPLHAMRYKGKEIIDDFACSYLPSASVLQFVNKNKDRPKEFNLKGIGVDFKKESGIFVSEVEDLIDLECFNKQDIFIKEKANKNNFFKNQKSYNILHSSTHGYASKQNPLKSSIILFMPDEVRKILDKCNEEEYYMEFESNPKIQACYITVEDLINNLNTSFDLIFMSACVTGENKNEAGDELIGLSRGLFYSGTKSMILSLFNVNKNIIDEEMDTYIKIFYESWILNQEYKSFAFKNFIATIRKKYKHPFHWFAYILIGNPY